MDPDEALKHPYKHPYEFDDPPTAADTGRVHDQFGRERAF
jgi:hypothetical protein